MRRDAGVRGLVRAQSTKCQNKNERWAAQGDNSVTLHAVTKYSRNSVRDVLSRSATYFPDIRGHAHRLDGLHAYMTFDPVTAARVRGIFGDAIRLSHAALARGLGVRKETLKAEGDRERLAFTLTPTERRVYTEAAVLSFLSLRDRPRPMEANMPRKNLSASPRRRVRASADAGAIDFQTKLAARRAFDPR